MKKRAGGECHSWSPEKLDASGTAPSSGWFIPSISMDTMHIIQDPFFTFFLTAHVECNTLWATYIFPFLDLGLEKIVFRAYIRITTNNVNMLKGQSPHPSEAVENKDVDLSSESNWWLVVVRLPKIWWMIRLFSSASFPSLDVSLSLSDCHML